MTMKLANMNEPTGVLDFSPDRSGEAANLIKSAPGKYEVFMVSAEDRDLVTSIRNVIDRLPWLLQEKRRSLTEAQIEKALDLLMGESEFADVDKKIEIDNAELRAAFLEREECYSSADIHKLSGSEGRNTSLPASRWKTEQRIFGVSCRGQDLYPTFQFRDGQPHPAIKETLKTLPADMTPWQIAFWFTAENGWLDGAKPRDCLDEGESLSEAALRESEPAIG